MKYAQYSHCDGRKIVPSTIQKEIESAISAVSVKPAPKAAREIRDSITSNLKVSGWSSEIPVAHGSDITITSVKNGIGLCLQTGNMARLYADLIKLQTLYLNDGIKGAIIIVPSAPVAKLLGSNIAQSNRLERELEIFKKAYHVPTIVFALE